MKDRSVTVIGWHNDMQGKGRVLSTLIHIVSNITMVTCRYHEGQDGWVEGGGEICINILHR